MVLCHKTDKNCLNLVIIVAMDINIEYVNPLVLLASTRTFLLLIELYMCGMTYLRILLTLHRLVERFLLNKMDVHFIWSLSHFDNNTVVIACLHCACCVCSLLIDVLIADILAFLFCINICTNLAVMFYSFYHTLNGSANKML